MSDCECGYPLTHGYLTITTHTGHCCPECPNCAGTCQPRTQSVPTYVQDVLDRFEKREEIGNARSRRTRRHA